MRLTKALSRVRRGVRLTPGLTVALESSYTGRVAHDHDDAIQLNSSGHMILEDNEATLSMGYPAWGHGNEKLITGFRFLHVNLAPGTPVQYADIQFTSALARSGEPVLLRIHAETSANPARFTSDQYNLEMRPLTTAYVNWEVPPWERDVKDAATRSPNIASVIQELVDSPSWVPGGAIVLLIECQWDPPFTPTEAGQRRNPWSHFAHPARAAVLRINTGDQPDPPEPEPEPEPDPGDPPSEAWPPDGSDDPVVAGAYYMAPNGSNSNPGTMAAPWRSISRAAQTLQPGDTLYLRGGVYSEYRVNAYDNVYGLQGAPGQWITIRSYPGEWAVIDGRNHPNHPRPANDGNDSNRHLLVFTRANRDSTQPCLYIQLQYLEFRYGVLSAVRFEYTNHIRMRGLRIHKNQLDGIYVRHDHTSPWGRGDPWYGRDIIVEDCDFYDNHDVWNDGNSASGLKMPYSYDVTVRRCRFYNNSDDGLDLYGSMGPWVVEHCHAWNNGYDTGGNGMGYKLGGSASSQPYPIHSADFRYNTSGHNWKQGPMTNRQYDMTIRNSTSWKDGGDNTKVGWWGGNCFDIRSDGPDGSPKNRLYNCIGIKEPNHGSYVLNNSQDLRNNSWQQGIMLPVDVQFLSVTPGHADFLRLSAGSPARGAGHDGSDLGAIPYGSYHPAPFPPIMVMIGGVSKVYPIE